MVKVFYLSFLTARRIQAQCKFKDPANPIPGALTHKARKEINKLQTKWAHDLLNILELKIIVENAPQGLAKDVEAALWVSNHMGFVDIPLIMSAAPFAYVAKKSISYWPFFGPGAAGIGSIFVDRSSHESRKKVAFDIAESITKKQKGVIIFPEGTSSIHGKPWKHGSFLIAKKHSIKIQPLCVYYKPLRTLAYVDDDTFVTSLWQLLGCTHGEAHIVFGEAFLVEDPSEDCKRTEAWVRQNVQRKMKEHDPSALAASKTE